MAYRTFMYEAITACRRSGGSPARASSRSFRSAIAVWWRGPRGSTAAENAGLACGRSGCTASRRQVVGGGRAPPFFSQSSQLGKNGPQAQSAKEPSAATIKNNRKIFIDRNLHLGSQRRAPAS